MQYVILGVLFILSLSSMETTIILSDQQVNELVHLANEKAFIEKIITHIGHQDCLETKFENLQILLKCGQVNKTWRHVVAQFYERILQRENRIVDEWQEWDYEQVAHLKNIAYAPIEHKWGEYTFRSSRSLEEDRMLGCAVQRNLLVWLHNFFSLSADRLTRNFYCAHTNNDYHMIAPCTWAIYKSATVSLQLITAMAQDKEAFKKNIADAQQSKELFDSYEGI